MAILALLLAAVIFVAYTNGANDNFKGVATLYGSRTAGYRQALAWATVTTLAGSVCSAFLAHGLVKAFSGKGLVPDEVCASPEFLASVALGAALTVLLATLIGFPISTTHALIGGLLGAGLVAARTGVEFSVLGQSFFLPLLVSPLLAVLLGGCSYVVFRWGGQRLGVTRELCVCVGETQQCTSTPKPASAMAMVADPALEVAVGMNEVCSEKYRGRVLGLRASTSLNALHYLSAGAVSFARGLNDTPKIVGLLVIFTAIPVQGSLWIVAMAMAVGGILNARKVAATMSERITTMTHGQGFTANLVTAGLVIVASRFGVPVSTTHVSCGSLFGMGLVTRQANTRVIRQILLSWVLTLPIAASLAALTCWMLG